MNIPFVGMRKEKFVHKTGTRIPHWVQEGASYFITFRCADSIPTGLARQWSHERECWLNAHPPPWTEEEERAYTEKFTARMEEWLDQGMGACLLRDQANRDLLEQALIRFDGIRLDVDGYVIMPNHVHLIIHPHENEDPIRLIGGMKGASARAIQARMGKSGETFWMPDEYNRIIRDAKELVAYRHYLEINPLRAGLHEREFTLKLNRVLSFNPWVLL